MRTTVAMALLFVCSVGIGFCVSVSFPGEEIAEISDPASPSNILLFLIPFGVITAIFLIFIKVKMEFILIYAIMALTWFLLCFSLTLLFSLAFGYRVSAAMAIATTGVMAYLFYFTKARMWTRNAVGVVGGGGAMGVLGRSIDVYPLIVIMTILAVYDGIAVYKTKHMFDIAEKAIEGNLPLLLSLPRGESESETMLMGLGDVIIPGTLAISAYTFYSVWASIPVLIGIGVGMFCLFRAISKGGQAGLLFLNTGGIVGFLVYLLFSFLPLS